MSIVTYLEVVLAAIIFGQCLLTVSFLIVKKDPQFIYAPLIIFFSVFIINSFGTMLSAFPFTSSNIFFKYACYIFAYVCLLLLFPTLWFYVRNITSSSSSSWRKVDIWHLMPFLIGLCVAALMLSLPDTMLAQILSDGTGPVTSLLITAAFSFYALLIVWVVQSVCYFFIIIRQLIKHKRRLKDYFSSTENKELVWVYCVVMLLTGSFSIYLLSVFTTAIDHISYLVQVLDLCLIFVLSHWGLRQGRFMTGDLLTSSIETTANKTSVKTSKIKYEKSALSQAHIDRIESNIHTVMQKDKLYLNPNLSLGDLAQAVAEPANYVSQTLNGRLGETFFDFINALRIQEALKLLDQQRKTVLDITYEVGFNSRSSFYKAFKRETGLTPTAYKQQLENK